MTAPGYRRTQAYREAHPERYEGERRRNAARQRAMVRLARRYPRDFKALFDEELHAAGLVPRG
jgi:hypothetical protein